jgi:hypothetical protein
LCPLEIRQETGDEVSHGATRQRHSLRSGLLDAGHFGINEEYLHEPDSTQHSANRDERPGALDALLVRALCVIDAVGADWPWHNHTQARS